MVAPYGPSGSGAAPSGLNSGMTAAGPATPAAPAGGGGAKLLCRPRCDVAAPAGRRMAMQQADIAGQQQDRRNKRRAADGTTEQQETGVMQQQAAGDATPALAGTVQRHLSTAAPAAGGLRRSLHAGNASPSGPSSSGAGPSGVQSVQAAAGAPALVVSPNLAAVVPVPRRSLRMAAKNTPDRASQISTGGHHTQQQEPQLEQPQQQQQEPHTHERGRKHGCTSEVRSGVHAIRGGDGDLGTDADVDGYMPKFKRPKYDAPAWCVPSPCRLFGVSNMGSGNRHTARKWAYARMGPYPLGCMNDCARGLRGFRCVVSSTDVIRQFGGHDRMHPVCRAMQALACMTNAFPLEFFTSIVKYVPEWQRVEWSRACAKFYDDLKEMCVKSNLDMCSQEHVYHALYILYPLHECYTEHAPYMYRSVCMPLPARSKLSDLSRAALHAEHDKATYVAYTQTYIKRGGVKQPGYARLILGYDAKHNPVPEYVHRIVGWLLYGDGALDVRAAPRKCKRLCMHACDKLNCICGVHILVGTQSNNMTGNKDGAYYDVRLSCHSKFQLEGALPDGTPALPSDMEYQI